MYIDVIDSQTNSTCYMLTKALYIFYILAFMKNSNQVDSSKITWIHCKL